MRTTVYPNPEHFVTSDILEQPNSAADEDPLQLSDAQRIKITQIFLRQLPLCCLTPRATKIVTAIFSQTIDYDKFEDDMNGKRLQQLTNLFPHHANEMVRNLEALHVLITRKGHYGKYLSVNFNFSQWGKEECNEVVTNDPTILLSKANTSNKAFRKARGLTGENAVLEQGYNPVAQPIDYPHDLLQDVLTAIGQIQTHLSDLSENQENAEKTAERTIKNTLQQANIENIENTIERLIKKHLPAEPASLEKMIERIVKKISPAEPVDLEKTIERIVKKALAKEKQAEPAEPIKPENKKTEPTREPVIEAVIEPETKKQHVENSEIPRPSQRIATALPDPIPTESSSIVNNTTELCFPPVLSDDQRYKAKKLLIRVEADEAQMLLDMLTKRMRNTSDPVKSPIGYLTNLLTRLQNGRLDMPMPTIAVASSPVLDEPRPLRESERRQAEYQEAVADCIQMERNIKLLGRKDSLTFTESLDKFDMRGLWESIRDRFTETKEALAAIQPLSGNAMSG